MKTLQTIIFLALTLPLFGQTKADFVNCLNLAFDQQEFQPAFGNHASTKGNLIIVSANSPQISRLSSSTLNDFRNSLTDDDFRFSNSYIKVLRPDELASLDIPGIAALKIFASGSELEMFISLESLVWRENLKYTWSYNFRKVEDEWEIIGRSLSKKNVNFSSW